MNKIVLLNWPVQKQAWWNYYAAPNEKQAINAHFRHFLLHLGAKLNLEKIFYFFLIANKKFNGIKQTGDFCFEYSEEGEERLQGELFLTGLQAPLFRTQSTRHSADNVIPFPQSRH